MVENLRRFLREIAGRNYRPTAMFLDSRTLDSTPESVAHGGYDGAKLPRGSQAHAGVASLGCYRYIVPSAGTACYGATDEQDRAQLAKLTEVV